ncbi:MAG: hypothetical protein EBX40_04780, partial [Gammaproteobacteria bacterium]|nr:hypothetical protein [Gammaproteobacteria bacterium]
MAGLPQQDDALPQQDNSVNVHNAFIERTIGPGLVSVTHALSQSTAFSKYFSEAKEQVTLGEGKVSIPRLKQITLPEDLKQYLPEGVEAPHVPEAFVQGFRLLVKAQEGKTEPKKEEFLRALMQKSLQKKEDWNNIPVSKSEVYALSNAELFGMVSLALMKLEAAEGLPESKGEESGAPLRPSRWSELWDYLRGDQEITTSCGTRYRNSLGMFLQSQGWKGLALVASESAFVQAMLVECFAEKLGAETLQAQATLLCRIDEGDEDKRVSIMTETKEGESLSFDEFKIRFLAFLESRYKKYAFTEKEKDLIKGVVNGDGFKAFVEATSLFAPTSPLFYVERA